MKTIKEINWKYALGEITLIFLGITSAIWFNNWNERQKANEIEQKSLIELRAAIGQDLGDIEENIDGFTHRVLLYRMIIDHIENNRPLSDELENKFPFIQGVTTFLSNIGPYETMKARGLEIITNDRLRNGVSIYYDVEYERIHTNERQHADHYNNYLKPIILKHFDMSKPLIQPINYPLLMNDIGFKQSIYWALRTDGYMLDNYKKIGDMAKNLQQELEEEIR